MAGFVVIAVRGTAYMGRGGRGCNPLVDSTVGLLGQSWRVWGRRGEKLRIYTLMGWDCIHEAFQALLK